MRKKLPGTVVWKTLRSATNGSEMVEVTLQFRRQSSLLCYHVVDRFGCRRVCRSMKGAYELFHQFADSASCLLTQGSYFVDQNPHVESKRFSVRRGARYRFVDAHTNSAGRRHYVAVADKKKK